jgi:hypothetical protein
VRHAPRRQNCNVHKRQLPGLCLACAYDATSPIGVKRLLTNCLCCGHRASFIGSWEKRIQLPSTGISLWQALAWSFPALLYDRHHYRRSAVFLIG